MIYEWYAEGRDAQAIADELREKGVLTTSGVPMTRSSVRRILENEVYVGDIKIGKTPSVDVITGAKDAEQYERYIENHHAGIVSRGLWNEVKRRREERKESVTQRKNERMRIIRLIKDDGSITASQIGEKLEINLAEVRYHIRELRKKGMLSREGSISICGYADDHSDIS